MQSHDKNWSVAVVEARTQVFLDTLAAKGEPEIDAVSIQEARDGMVSSQRVVGFRVPSDVRDYVLPVGPMGHVAIRIVRPTGVSEALPVIMYFHGGGWVLGDSEAYDRLIREIAARSYAAVVFVDYSRSPEVQYPVAAEEAYAATKWVVDNAETINLDSARLAVVGDSSGGNLATVVTMLAKERGGPTIHYQVLFCPTTDCSFDTDSYRQFAAGYFLTTDQMKWFWNQYVPDLAVREQPTVSPLRASLEQLQGLPPALIITAECDVLRDEGEAYGRKLMQAGVQVTATRYLSTIHAFVVLNAIANTPAARGAINQATSTLRGVFATQPVPDAGNRVL